MRLIDQVRLGQFTKWPSLAKTWNGLAAFGALNLNDAIPVDITNIYNWQQSDWDLSDIPKRKQIFGFCHDLRPSFDSTWFEWKMNAFNDRDQNRQVKVDGRAMWCVSCPDVLPGWTMLFFERQDGKVTLTHIFSIELEATTPESVSLIFPVDETDEDISQQRGFLMGVMTPVILAQNLMHCKNVKVERTEMPPKLAKKFARNHGGKQPARFRTVKIEPMKKVMVNCGGVQGVGVQKAMHIVRGHFAEYTEERPLFGHFTGKVFRAQHVRGDEKLGVKTPEYAVVRPAKGKAA